jgi:hypothetical protein
MAKAKKRGPRRAVEVVEEDRLRVLRTASRCPAGHWVLTVPGQDPACTSCASPAPPPEAPREEWEVQALAECLCPSLGVSVEAYMRGWRAASEATAAAALPVELLEVEEEDLDGLVAHPGLEE